MKMDKLIRILGGVLGAQVLLAAITWWPSGGTDGEARDLIATDASNLSSIVIHGRAGGTEDPLELRQDGGNWTIASLEGYPASDTQLETLFETIDKLKVRTPVVNNAYHHSEMDVADDAYNRKLEITTEGGDTTVLYLGSAQGKSAHVRIAGSDEVYRVRGVSSTVPERASRYFDRDFQKVDVESVRSVVIARPEQEPIRFVWENDAWAIPGLVPPGQTVDQGVARQFVQSAVNLRMLEPHGRATTPQMGLQDGVTVSWTEEQDDGSSLAGEYTVGAEVPGESGQVFLKSSTSPFVFRGMANQLQHALEKPVDELFVDPGPPPALEALPEFP